MFIKKSRCGRPAGSLARIPQGHVDLNGLAALLGVSATTIPNLEKRRDPRIPPRSPLAGFGAHRRMIWSVDGVHAHLYSLDQSTRAATPDAITAPANSAFGWTGGEVDAKPKRRPGRPRKTSK